MGSHPRLCPFVWFDLNTAVTVQNKKEQKRLAKKEQLDRQIHEIERIKTILIFQDVLANFDGDAKADFLSGSNGAMVSEELLPKRKHEIMTKLGYF